MLNTLTTCGALILLLASCSDQVGENDAWRFRGSTTEDVSDVAVDQFEMQDVGSDIAVKKDVSFDVAADIVEDTIPPVETALLLSDVRYADLLTGAPRFALSGFDNEAKVCVALIVQFSSSYCFDGPPDEDIVGLFIQENVTNSDCWDYKGTLDFEEASGCVQFDRGQENNDIQFTVKSENYNKTIRFF